MKNFILVIIMFFLISCVSEPIKKNKKKISEILGIDLESVVFKDLIRELELNKEVLKGDDAYYSYKNGIEFHSINKKVWRISLYASSDGKYQPYTGKPFDFDIIAPAKPENLLKKMGKPFGKRVDDKRGETTIEYVKDGDKLTYFYTNNVLEYVLIGNPDNSYIPR